MSALIRIENIICSHILHFLKLARNSEYRLLVRIPSFEARLENYSDRKNETSKKIYDSCLILLWPFMIPTDQSDHIW